MQIKNECFPKTNDYPNRTINCSEYLDLLRMPAFTPLIFDSPLNYKLFSKKFF